MPSQKKDKKFSKLFLFSWHAFNGRYRRFDGRKGKLI